MLPEAMILMLAVMLVTAGALSGWMLRGRFLGQSFGKSETDAIHPEQANLASRAASRDPQVSDYAARLGDLAGAIKPAHPDSVPAATAADPMDNETAAPCVRNTFCLALGHRLAESARRGDPLSVILVRIDNYEDLSERYGLQVGNQILDAAGRFFIASVRAMDWVARFDMTTFAFLLPNTAHGNALRVAERLRTTVSSSGMSMDGSLIPLTLSLGTTEAMPHDSSGAILRRAEEAMHASVQTGGNCIHSHDREGLEAACRT